MSKKNKAMSSDFESGRGLPARHWRLMRQPSVGSCGPTVTAIEVGPPQVGLNLGSNNPPPLAAGGGGRTTTTTTTLGSGFRVGFNPGSNPGSNLG